MPSLSTCTGLESSTTASSRSVSPGVEEEASSAEASRSASPGEETGSKSATPRFDTSSLSFLESLDYDPMEGPSWLFESLKKKKKRKSAATSGGGRKRRKASRRSSPFLLESPNLRYLVHS